MTDTNATHGASTPLSAHWFERPELLERPAVVTGAFDVLHVGHVRFLRTIAERGLPLVVGIESDLRVGAWKGPGRPVNPAGERAETVAALASVAGAFVIEGPPEVADWSAYAELLRPIDPAALAYTAGDRYTQAKIRGADALGSQAWELPFTPGRSTTAALGRLAHSL
ncbi:adenylyltransferase/cytidyltransferase family protein [Nocardiopsis sp. NPDC058631]|uniref:adenylyltransferase/cytidyltransferase family protein n=1 Tax=Nocardiopsis sp. NPDC058631 TaxID=3346566 RepID=UPI00364F542B